MTRRHTPREAIQHRGYCTGPVDGTPASNRVGPDNRVACCTCGRRVSVTARGHYVHHRASIESQLPIARTLLPRLTRLQIKKLRRYDREGSWYRVHHMHGHTLHSLQRRGLIAQRGVTPLGHAVLRVDQARIPDIFANLFSSPRSAQSS